VPNVASQIVAVATEADYRIDPTRWGSAAVAVHFPGFRHLDIRTSGAIIRLRHGGSGPPLLLVHGNPQNHTCWYKVAAKLAEHFHVVLPDLRGYGDSSLPEPGPDNVNFSFREMARDLIEVMQALGHERFMVAGHDRGARTAFRLVLDQPDRVSRLCLMDILPNYHVWTNTTMSWAIGTWHWGFMAQPEPFPERLISAVPARYFIESRMLIRGRTGLGFLTEAAIEEYVRCYTLKTITGSCRDYRACATSDFVMTPSTRIASSTCHFCCFGVPEGRHRSVQQSSSTCGGAMQPTSSRPRRSSADITSRRRCPRRCSTTSPDFSRRESSWLFA